jgi:hypothetical protein
MESAVKGFGKYAPLHPPTKLSAMVGVLRSFLIDDRTSSIGLVLIAGSDLLELVEDKTDND